MEDEDTPELKEVLKQNYFVYLEKCRGMMMDNPENQEGFQFLGCTIQRANSENNIWDILLEQDNGKPMLINSINPNHYETANSLLNEMAEIVGIDFEDDEPDIARDQTESPAFR
jgi:hypothetical protein